MNNQKQSLKKSFTFPLNLCKYNVKIMFSTYDVLDGEELQIENVYMNDEKINLPKPELINKRYVYSIELTTTKLFTLRIEKTRYFPFIGKYNLDVNSIFDDQKVIDLNRIGLLNEIREDAIVLTWNLTPTDLDSRLLCPNGEIVRRSSA